MPNSISITTGDTPRSRPNDFFSPASHAFGDISCVDDQRGFLHDPRIINLGMVRDNHCRIDVSEKLFRKGRRFQLQMVFSETGKGRNEGVVVTEDGSFLLKELDDGKSG